MKIPFKWEDIYQAESPMIYYFHTIRAKVPGGWLVRNWDMTTKFEQVCTTESMVFISDPNHEWEIE